MKCSFFWATLLAVALLAACSKENNNNNNTTPVDTIPERDIPTGTLRAPEWVVDSNYDYSSSMTAVVAVDLARTYPDITPADWQLDTADRLGAFVGNSCIGLTAPSDSLFFLYIVTPPQDAEGDIQLRYYSAQLHNIFLSDTLLHFENGARIGSVADPLTPAFRE